MTKMIEGQDCQYFIPPIFDVTSIKEVKLEEANKTLMPIDYSGIFGYMYSIVGEGNTSMST